MQKTCRSVSVHLSIRNTRLCAFGEHFVTNTNAEQDANESNHNGPDV